MKVLFIGGMSRSGSTLLDRLLGQVPGFVSVGELRHIWFRGMVLNELCGCGREFRACTFWRTVMIQAYGNAAEADLRWVDDIKARVERTRYVPWLLGAAPPHYTRMVSMYRRELVRLYKAIAAVADASVIVDSSKHPVHGLVANGVPNVELFAVHLVRDSRAVAFSLQRRRDMPLGSGRTRPMLTGEPSAVARLWLLNNALMHVWQGRAAGYLRLRYEDLIRDPADAIRRIIEMTGRPVPELDFVSARDGTHLVQLEVNHLVSGNPVRFTTGAVPLVPDLEWTHAMDSMQRLLLTAITWPLLIAYGYTKESHRS